MNGLALAGRAGISLVLVLGLLWGITRLLRGRTQGRVPGVVEVVSRQALGRTASVTVVRVGARALVLGVTESHVTLLGDTELPAPAVATAAPAVLPQSTGSAVAAAQRRPGALAGSVLSPSTWRAGVAFLREKTVRRT